MSYGCLFGSALITFLITVANAIAQPAICNQFEGSIVIADRKFIGKVSNRYESDSIFNKYGSYGSKYASDSIWNPYGTYGSKYSSDSATNPYTSTPPQIVKNRRIIGYLSRNKNLAGSVDPLLLGIECFDYEP